eukprot:TRINITY_DN33278_c0_g1_i1.p1 TRINITY_DN33278_c0_g1~~TRINITY_DN33278_c0_g1_i1.p1  ORF type:complete len:223 (-),score=7.59 TRINITY_DN33278_c0_g1_i1:143-754(-)
MMLQRSAQQRPAATEAICTLDRCVQVLDSVESDRTMDLIPGSLERPVEHVLHGAGKGRLDRRAEYLQASIEENGTEVADNSDRLHSAVTRPSLLDHDQATTAHEEAEVVGQSQPRESKSFLQALGGFLNLPRRRSSRRNCVTMFRRCAPQQDEYRDSSSPHSESVSRSAFDSSLWSGRRIFREASSGRQAERDVYTNFHNIFP